mgnify:FL=1
MAARCCTTVPPRGVACTNDMTDYTIPRQEDADESPNRPNDQLRTNGGTAYTELTAFERDILCAAATHIPDRPSGIDLKTALSDRYPEPINHGRLYPALDHLVDAGLLEKGITDGRTNAYTVTPAGLTALETHHERLATALTPPPAGA